LVWIIILNWNGWQDTIECLQSLKKITDPKVRILVVDNASTDESLAKLHQFQKTSHAPEFELLESQENLGFAGGMNLGIIHAMTENPDWLLLLNNDTVVEPTFLTTLLEAAKTDPKIVILNPKILLKGKPEYFWFAGGKLDKLLTKGSHVGLGEQDTGQYDIPPVRDTDYSTGGCLLVRRSVIDKIGLLPEEYFVYYEDTEWSLRAERAGFRCVVVPKAKIWHAGAASSKEFSESYIRYHVRNGLLLNRRMGNPMQVVKAYFLSLLRAGKQLIKLLHEHPQERIWAKTVLLGICDAWLGKTGKI